MNRHLALLALGVGLVACGGTDTDTDALADTDADEAVPFSYTSPEACAGATRIRADGPEGFYNVIPTTFVNYGGRLWMSATAVNAEDTTLQPGIWAPLDCSGEDAPLWRMVGTERYNRPYLVSGHDRLVLSNTREGITSAQFIDEDAEPVGDPISLSAPAASTGNWGLTATGFYVAKDWTDERLDVLLLDQDLDASGLLSFEDVPRDGNAASFGPPGQPGIAAIDDENGRLVHQRLDGTRMEYDLPLGRVGLMPSNPNTPFYVRSEEIGLKNVLTDGEREHILDLPPGSFATMMAPEGEGFWIASLGNVYWLETWDAELELVASVDDDPELTDYRASRIAGAGGNRVAVLYTDWSGTITSTVRIFER